MITGADAACIELTPEPSGCTTTIGAQSVIRSAFVIVSRSWPHAKQVTGASDGEPAQSRNASAWLKAVRSTAASMHAGAPPSRDAVAGQRFVAQYCTMVVGGRFVVSSRRRAQSAGSVDVAIAHNVTACRFESEPCPDASVKQRAGASLTAPMHSRTVSMLVRVPPACAAS